MNYRSKKVAITGAKGFLGSAIMRRITPEYGHNFEQRLGPQVEILAGDIRNPDTFKALDGSFDYLFHFAAPSSQVLFKRAPQYCIESTILGFKNAKDVARRHGIKLIYPSTGLLSQGKSNEYARCKQLCEDMHLGGDFDALGLRIFATYGPGEAHKDDYASVPYLLARDMVEGRHPVIFGDGNQSRDFIFVDDVVEAILHLTQDSGGHKIVDVGSGVKTTFNQILDHLEEITNELMPEQAGKITARHIDAPAGYVDETLANTEILEQFYRPQIAMRDGLHKMVESIIKVQS